ncbi:uncharacterized protein BDW43DRAFT_296642 [Aspergillus alliaceus]|uniref:uncharacterized protein n=1 Tax=Petromyces alliaceus TaxID=209559 RepID=UPI0012A6E435|nr:uncharacterized protein BDW43DRAFT_296642 [Aspergillus alliaceus]KAB8238360.1 hypothetical protein BDW43DRAFT_296642 [Aspergillus alliaceus]
MSQTVIRINSPTNSIHNLEALEIIPEPGKNEVLIKVHGVSLNYRGIAVSTSLYMAAVVVKVDENVKKLAAGDHVIGDPIDSILREYVYIPAVSVFQVPKESPLILQNVLYGNIPLSPARQFSYKVCTGAVSITALILAKAAGATIFMTSSSDEKLESVQKAWGVNYTINYKTHPEWSKEALRLANSEGADYILENGGSGTIGESLNAVKMGGNISVIGFLSQIEQSKMSDVASLTLANGAVARGIVVGKHAGPTGSGSFCCPQGIGFP